MKLGSHSVWFKLLTSGNTQADRNHVELVLFNPGADWNEKCYSLYVFFIFMEGTVNVPPGLKLYKDIFCIACLNPTLTRGAAFDACTSTFF